jgi:hypothetical protein
MKTKLIYILFALLPFLIGVSSCKEDDGDTTPPSPVDNIVITPDFGGFKLSWQNPTDVDFRYVDLSYTDALGNQWSKKISQYGNSTQVAGLTEEKDYTFNLVSYDKSGNASGTKTISGKCKTPPFLVVAQELAVNPDFGGINVKWENTCGKQVAVMVQYKDNNGAKQVQTTVSNKPNDVLFVSGLQAKSQVFKITVSDSIGNAGPTKDYNLTPLAESLIEKNGWEVVSFSSEEASGEGTSNGRVIHAIDGNINSFWHSQWAGGTPPYPHWFIINMNQTVTISRFECYRRQGDSGGPDKIKFYASMDGQTWTDLGENTFNRNVNTAQSYRISSNPEARYFKFEATAGPNTFSHLGEINVFGSAK